MTLELGSAHATTAGLAGPTIFHAAAWARDRVAVEASGQRYPVSPVSAGFVALRTDPPSPARRRAASAAIEMGRPVALVGESAAATAAELAAETGSRWVHPPRDGFRAHCHFVVPAAFVRARAAAIRRLQGARRPVDHLPYQRITAVGVGPWMSGNGAEVRHAIARAEAVVATDWTLENTLPSLGLRRDVSRHVVPYDVMDYDATVAGVSDTVDALQEAGVREVALLIEGNPDTYDVLDGLCLARRRLEVVPGVPIGLAAAGDVGRRLPRNPFGSQLAYLSGLPARHGQTRERLLDELTRYLAAGLPCALVEMTAGDIGLVVRAARNVAVPMTLVLVTDFYSPAARTIAVSAASARTRALLEHARGRLNTLLVFEESFGDDEFFG